MAVSEAYAASEDLRIGSTVPVTFPTGAATFTVRAAHERGTDWVGDQFLGLDGFRAAAMGDLDFRVYVAGDGAAIEAVAAAYALAEVLDEDGFLDVVNAEVDSMLGLFYAMLGLAVVIALFGIANTLSLSTFERTRELGLLRAVGMHRGQLRSSVRWEAVIIAVFGATLGLGVGTFFGWAVVRAMAGEGLDGLTIPVANLLVVTGVAALAGAVAAVLPARRAARLKVLEAVSAA
ncbi:MAG: ABC transporter permease [Acidimicrobiia bacterium]